jgi:GNAT superfamily N-acetyltransferase
VVEIRSGGSAEDLNAVVRLHRQVYEDEYELDASFADAVAVRMSELRRAGWPGPGGGLWLAELEGTVVGSATLREHRPGLARLGHLVLLPEARGVGAGRRLVESVLAAAREAGYERVELFTFSELAAARSLYGSVGFVLDTTERVMRWGRPVDWERWERAL